MYCPKCGTDNADASRFCRHCGQNLSLIPRAMTGDLPVAPPDNEYWSGRLRRRARRHNSEPNSLQEAIRCIFSGVFFAGFALILTRLIGWPGYFILIPGFAQFGRGLAYILANSRNRAQIVQQQPQQTLPPQSHQIAATGADLPFSTDPVPPPSVTESTGATGSMPPPSVTEGTTRIFNGSGTGSR